MSTGSSEDVLNAGNYGPARFFSAPYSLSLSLVLFSCLLVSVRLVLTVLYVFFPISLFLSLLIIENVFHVHTSYSLNLYAISAVCGTDVTVKIADLTQSLERMLTLMTSISTDTLVTEVHFFVVRLYASPLSD